MMSNENVKKATGKTWPQWFNLLDRVPKTKTHTERAAWLYQHHLKKGWWAQMVVVTYEQARGLRKIHQTSTGFQISANKTVPISIGQLYRWWTTKRSRWLKVRGMKITSATKNKYLHFAWPGGSRLDVGFYAVGKSKSTVSLGHTKLKNATAAKKMKVWWKKQLTRLADAIEAA